MEPGDKITSNTPVTPPVTAIIFDMYGVLYDGGRFNDGLLAAIRQLKPSYKLGLLSNIGRNRLDEFLANPLMANLFDATLASSETRFSKPHPDVFEEITERLDVSAGESLFIDDSEDNVSGAAAVGMRAHLFRSNNALCEWLRQQGIVVAMPMDAQ